MPSKDIFLSIVAPAYNEEANIESVIRYWQKILSEDRLPGEIVITNDGSTDRTGEFLKRLKKEYPNLKVINFKTNGGYGRALSTSIAYARGKYILTTDSDGQFDVAEYKLLLNKLEKGGYDVVTGFRKRKVDSLAKVFADRVLNKIVRLFFGIRLTDTNCALKLFKREVIQSINIDANGYPTPTELLLKLNALGYSIAETGITHFEREGGKSKLKILSTGINFLKFLLYLKLKVRLYRSKVLNKL
jgi:glycosyltransferase involved in cell wall biosynthesis